MKKTALIFSFVNVSFALSAQSIADGKSYLENERYASAESAFHAVLNQQPANAEAWYLLTSTYFKQELANEAADTLALAPPSVHEDPYYLVAYGGLLLNTDKADSANHYFEQAISLTKSKDAGILAAVAEAHIESAKGNPDYALQVLEKALKRDKKNAGLLVLQGNAYRRLHKGSEAYQAYQEAIGLDKNSPNAYFQLGRIFLTQKNAEMYIDYFNKSIAADKAFARPIMRCTIITSIRIRQKQKNILISINHVLIKHHSMIMIKRIFYISPNNINQPLIRQRN